MADDQPQSIADRIAALKLNQVGRAPGQLPKTGQPTNGVQGTGKRPPPPPPPRPSLPARPQSSNVPPAQGYAPVSNDRIGNQPEVGQPNGSNGLNGSNGMDGVSRPVLPPRTSTQSSQGPNLPPRRPSESPALPPRRPSEAPSLDGRRQSNYSLSRRESNESVSSNATARSGLSGISNGTSVTSQQSVKAPAYDPSALPPLPPKRTQEEKEADYRKYHNATAGKRILKTTKSTPKLQQKQIETTPPPPARPNVKPPPQLPSRSVAVEEAPARIEAPPRQRDTVAPPPRRSALTMGYNNSTNTAPPVTAARPISVPPTNDGAAPPPIPTSSRPDLTALQSSKPKLNGSAAPAPASTSPGSCLLCRDFSAPDNHAARFPRQSLPSSDLGWLANQLTCPFPSHTDKARALFTWLHHNVEYDVVAFFNNNVRPSTPQSTLQTGLAVCEGYAGLFAALAMKAGLEAYVVSGHGKGYGYSALQPGDPLPPYNAGHAWNVVKIDNGQWKLIDCCWGAGTVNGKGQPYNKRFAPERFTQSNDDFGRDHFPGDSDKQFRSDGRAISWEEYILGNKNGCGADFFSGFVVEEGLSAPSFKPTSGKISLSQQPAPTIRFSFQKVCPHWDPVRCGKGPYYLYVLALDGLDGTQRNHVPFETNGDVWWCDVPIRDLGGPGMKAQIYSVTNFNGAEGRGLTIQKYREMHGRCGMAFGGVCKWEVVG